MCRQEKVKKLESQICRAESQKFFSPEFHFTSQQERYSIMRRPDTIKATVSKRAGCLFKAA